VPAEVLGSEPAGIGVAHVALLGAVGIAGQHLALTGARETGSHVQVDGGRIVGIVRREDVLRWLSVYGDSRLGLGGSRPA